tara:strand:+ start:451 stop:993 length:543 start_codon:yes stop_codon:yes gene_type:complete
MYKKSEISLQISKNTLILNKEKNKAKLNVDKETANFIKEVSKAVIEITADNSERFFGKEINVEDCESIYKEALVDDILHCFYDEDTYFFESKTKQLNIDELPCQVEGITLLKCSAIVYTKHSFFIRWEISQFKIKKPKDLDQDKEDISAFNGYMIKDLSEHEITLDEEHLIKKLDEICLF